VSHSAAVHHIGPRVYGTFSISRPVASKQCPLAFYELALPGNGDVVRVAAE